MAKGMTKSLVVVSRSHQSIRVVDVATATVRTLVSGLEEAPDGVVVDQTNEHIYWTNMGRPDAVIDGDDSMGYFQRDGSIERVNFDGRERTTVVQRGAFTTGKQLTADFSAGHLYWCDREGMKVLRANLDGSDLTVLYAAGQTDEDAQDPRNHCVGVAVDPAGQRLFWTQKGPPKGNQGRIFTAGLELPPETNPAKRSDVGVLWSGLPEPIDLEFDNHKRLVWTDRGAEPTRKYSQSDVGRRIRQRSADPLTWLPRGDRRGCRRRAILRVGPVGIASRRRSVSGNRQGTDQVRGHGQRDRNRRDVLRVLCPHLPAAISRHPAEYAGRMTSAEELYSTLGQAIRRQRELAELPMRQLAAMVGISNPYLSQIERALSSAPLVRSVTALRRSPHGGAGTASARSSCLPRLGVHEHSPASVWRVQCPDIPPSTGRVMPVI